MGVGGQNLAGEAGCLARDTLVPRNWAQGGGDHAQLIFKDI